MGDIDVDIQKLLAGEVLEVKDSRNIPDACGSSKDEDYVPIVKRTVCYIVMAFVFDDNGQILLIQEAKESCRGKWYLPAGRVEPGENLIDGVKREVLEEAGLHIEPVTLCDLETYGTLTWFRINYIGNVTGGKLKTLAEQDKESLQAQWFPVQKVLTGQVDLRHSDFFRTLKIAHTYVQTRNTSRHPCYQIGIKEHKHLCIRPVILKQTTPRDIEVLCYQDSQSLPYYRFNHNDTSLHYLLNHLFQDAFNLKSVSKKMNIQLQGLLTLEHCGVPAREHDGICFTPVFVVPENLHSKFQTITNPVYSWHKIINSEVIEELNNRVFTQNLLIHIHS
ncbi:8-hydroxy-dADP phosphatase [Mactra antiquata]